jgi:hypothetical protein
MMKAQLIVATIAGLTCAPALAFGDGYLSLYSDAAFTECTLSDTSPKVRNVYLVELVSGAVGLRFRIGGSPGFTRCVVERYVTIHYGRKFADGFLSGVWRLPCWSVSGSDNELSDARDVDVQSTLDNGAAGLYSAHLRGM